MEMSLETLLLLQSLLLSQQLVVGAADEEIQTVLTAKRELAEAIAKAQPAPPNGLPKQRAKMI